MVANTFRLECLNLPYQRLGRETPLFITSLKLFWYSPREVICLPFEFQIVWTLVAHVVASHDQPDNKTVVKQWFNLRFA